MIVTNMFAKLMSDNFIEKHVCQRLVTVKIVILKKPENNMNTQNKLRKVLDLISELDSRKALYDELDRLTLELQAEGFSHELLDGKVITLRDNFADKNTVFRVAGVKHYEIIVESPETVAKREAKKKSQ